MHRKVLFLKVTSLTEAGSRAGTWPVYPIARDSDKASRTLEKTTLRFKRLGALLRVDLIPLA